MKIYTFTELMDMIDARYDYCDALSVAVRAGTLPVSELESAQKAATLVMGLVSNGDLVRASAMAHIHGLASAD
jgi:hypothetical protein